MPRTDYSQYYTSCTFEDLEDAEAKLDKNSPLRPAVNNILAHAEDNGQGFEVEMMESVEGLLAYEESAEVRQWFANLGVCW